MLAKHQFNHSNHLATPTYIPSCWAGMTGGEGGAGAVVEVDTGQGRSGAEELEPTRLCGTFEKLHSEHKFAIAKMI